MSLTALPSVPCSEIEPSTVSWLWEPYLARGKLSVLDGDPGTGKSFVAVDLAARITAGFGMPGSAAPQSPASVLLLNAEDDARDTIRPRVVAAAGDPGRLRILAAPGLGLERLPRLPDDTAALEAAIRETGAAFVVIDPLMAFLAPGVSANNDQSVRQALTPLADAAAATGACVLLVRHLRKANAASALYRGLGSIGIAGAVRTALVVSRHPDDPDIRVLAHDKSNIGPIGRSLGFRLGTRNESRQAFVDWIGPMDLTADDALGTGAPMRAGVRARERAAEWLRQFLSDGPRRAAEVVEAALAAGIAERTLNRVKATVGIKSEQKKRDGVTEWWWRDPAARGRSEDLDGPFGELPEIELPELEPLELDLPSPREQRAALRAAMRVVTDRQRPR
jgi:hypothetical protein